MKSQMVKMAERMYEARTLFDDSRDPAEVADWCLARAAVFYERARRFGTSRQRAAVNATSPAAAAPPAPGVPVKERALDERPREDRRTSYGVLRKGQR